MTHLSHLNETCSIKNKLFQKSMYKNLKFGNQKGINKKFASLTPIYP